MTRRSEQISLHLNAYLNAHSTPPDAILRELASETAERYPNDANLQVAPEEGTLLTVLTRMSKARSAIEIGTFTGYSSICIARGLGDGGRLLCCDVSEEWTSIARRYWEKAGLSELIELRLAPALATLRALPREETFDLAFIDADKVSYPAYWTAVVPRRRRPCGQHVLAWPGARRRERQPGRGRGARDERHGRRRRAGRADDDPGRRRTDCRV